VHRLAIAFAGLLLTAVGAAAVVRQATPVERTQLGAAVDQVWRYESSLGNLKSVRSPDHPIVAGIRVSNTNPAFASVAVELRDARDRRVAGTAVVAFEKIGGSWQQVTDAARTFSHGCTPATPVAMRDLLCPSPWAVLGLPRPSVPAAPAYSLPIASADLHAVDWADVRLPAAACGASEPIQLRKGQAMVHSSEWPWWAVVVVYAHIASYGDLAGNGRDDAAEAVICSNGGGTADGQLASADVVFKPVGHTLRVVGIITPQQPLNPSTPHVPLLGGVDIQHGQITAHEFWYGPADGTCCASGRAETIWAYRNGALQPTRTIVEKQPAA